MFILAALSNCCSRESPGASSMSTTSKEVCETADPLQLVLLWGVSAGPAGYCSVPVPIGPRVNPGLQVYAQFFWLPDPCAPQGMSSSNALELTIQP